MPLYTFMLMPLMQTHGLIRWLAWVSLAFPCSQDKQMMFSSFVFIEWNSIQLLLTCKIHIMHKAQILKYNPVGAKKDDINFDNRMRWIKNPFVSYFCDNIGSTDIDLFWFCSMSFCVNHFSGHILSIKNEVCIS